MRSACSSAVRRRAPYRDTVALLQEALDLAAPERALLDAAAERGRKQGRRPAVPADGALQNNLPARLNKSKFALRLQARCNSMAASRLRKKAWSRGAVSRGGRGKGPECAHQWLSFLDRSSPWSSPQAATP
jgi:hypothetical protein